jgi:hypothetical protein
MNEKNKNFGSRLAIGAAISALNLLRAGILALWAKLLHRQKMRRGESGHDVQNGCIESLAENDNRRNAWSL